MMEIKIKRLHEAARLPTRGTEHSAGADLYACLEAPVTILPGERRTIPTGLALEIPPGHGGFVFPRSSVASRYGLSLSNCVGVIDADYRGEVAVALLHHGGEPYTVRHGDRIAQLVVMPVCMADFTFSDELTDTVRGEGGFGSTGR